MTIFSFFKNIIFFPGALFKYRKFYRQLPYDLLLGSVWTDSQHLKHMQCLDLYESNRLTSLLDVDINLRLLFSPPRVLRSVVCLHRCINWLAASILVSTNKSSTHFFWERETPYLDLDNLIPRKYRNCASSFISNFDVKNFWSWSISLESFPVMTISSTYTINVVTFPLLCLINKVWSELLCL